VFAFDNGGLVTTPTKHVQDAATLVASHWIPSNPTCDSLDKFSTSLDVVRHLRSRKSALSPFVGPQGVALVTGGTSGIGRQTMETLASSGIDMRVILCARNTDSARETLDEICHVNPQFNRKNVRIQPLDLADLSSVRAAVDEIVATEGSIDVLCNNAGVIAPGGTTAQNFEVHMGINHIGHFYLTRLLLPHVNKGGRVVTVASSAHSAVRKFCVDDLNFTQGARRYSPWSGYTSSKLANILFAKALQDKVVEHGRNDILSLSLHPGIVKTTNLWRQSDYLLVQSVRDTLLGKSVEQGAATEVFCCIANAKYFFGGDYVVDCHVSTPHFFGVDEDKVLRRKLWVNTEELITKAGFELPEKLF
jgi:NAD(P)-dependent dehydrogenase (short-subunit alcohol dehydrogenase family)